MECRVINRINNCIICKCQVVEFRGRTLTVESNSDDIASIQKCILTGELDDESFRGDIEIVRINGNIISFKVAKAGIYDRRRYLRISMKQKAKIYIDGHDDMIILTELAYMSCRIGYCGRQLAVGEHVVIKINTGNDEIKIDGDVMQYCGSFGHGAIESQIYIITFEGYSTGSIEGDSLYSYILRLAEGNM